MNTVCIYLSVSQTGNIFLLALLHVVLQLIQFLCLVQVYLPALYLWPLEKLIEGLKSPDTSSLMLPDLLSLSDPFGGSVEESAKGVCVCVCALL